MEKENYIFHFDNSYSRLKENFFTRSKPVQVKSPKTVLFNSNLAKELKLDMGLIPPDTIAQLFSGNILPFGSQPLAQAYAGHQFGYFTMLGDGRAILLGEHITPDNKRVDIQLKGSGQTAYSRSGDGRATLRSMLREYLISEAIHGLGILGSRSLAVVTTGEKVTREETHEGAVLTRIASSHIRVGTFEYVSNFLSKADLQSFTDYVVKRHFPDLVNSDNQALELIKAVMKKQIDLVVNWLRVGFIHGVMNTDNVSVAGETFDYGPCAFINAFDPNAVFSSIDTHGRYSFGNQPRIAHWNLTCFAGALLPLIHSDSSEAIRLAQTVLDDFPREFELQRNLMIGRKLGFSKHSTSESVKNLADELHEWMKLNTADYTNTFLALQSETEKSAWIYSQPSFRQWHQKWKSLLSSNGISLDEAYQTMQTANPVYIPRNYQVEKALDNACLKNDYDLYYQLLKVAASPYQNHEGCDSLQTPPKDNDLNYKTFCGT